MHDLFLSIAKPLNREVVKAGEEREMEGPVLQFSFIAPAINTPRSRGHWHIPYSLSNSFLPINPWASSLLLHPLPIPGVPFPSSLRFLLSRNVSPGTSKSLFPEK